MVDDWYYKWEGMEYGPVTFDTLFHLAQGTAIGPDSEVKAGEAGEWVPASSLVGLIADRPDESEDDIVVVEATDKPPKDDVAFPMSPVVTPAADAQFYWRSFGQDFGPVPFETFHEMIRRDELSSDDEIRIEAPGGWLPVGGLKEIAASFQPTAAAVEFESQPGAEQSDTSVSDPFADMASAAGLESANADDLFDEVMTNAAETSAPAAAVTPPSPPVSDTEPPAAVPPKPAVEPSPVAVASPPTPAPRPPASTATPKAAPPPPVKLPKPKRTGPLIDWGSIFSGFEFSPKLLVPVALVLVVVAYKFIPWGSGVDQEYYDKLAALQGEFRQLRDSSASPNQWKALENKVKTETEPMLADLKERASAKRPIPQNLLFAARDYLPEMFRTATEAPDENEKNFNDHLERTRKLMAGEPLFDPQPVETTPADGPHPDM